MTYCKHCGDAMFRNPSEQEPTEYTDAGFCSESCREEYESRSECHDCDNQVQACICTP